MVADDHGRESLGCYGNPRVRTPHLDELAASGVRLSHAFCTSASCCASRSAILTGQHNHTNGTYGHTHGVHHFSAFDGVETLPKFLAEAGYRTGRVGKKHYAPEPLFPFDYDPPEAEWGRDDVGMSKSCREFVRGDEPFFLYWCSFNPHRDERTLETHPSRPNRFGNPDRAFPGDVEMLFDEDAVEVPHFLPDCPETRAELAQYCQSIARLDRGVGRLIEELERAGKLEDTLIIYLSDNGSAFPGSKTTVYDTGIQLPCLVRGPGITAGLVTDGLVSWTDITPTILDFAGVTFDPERFFGRSFREILNEPHPESWRRTLFAAHTFHEITNYYPMRALRTHEHKFIWNVAHGLPFSFAEDLWESPTWRAMRRSDEPGTERRTVEAFLNRPRFELYNLNADPRELRNLAGDPAAQELVDRYSAELRDFQTRTNDPWLHKWIYE